MDLIHYLPQDPLTISSIVLILILCFGLISSRRTICELKKRLENERKKRLFPLLILELVTSEENPGLHLRNDSYCYAKNIAIENMPITVDVGFQKRLFLKFESIALLKPNTSTALTYKIFDGEFDVTTVDPGKLVNYLPTTDIEIKIVFTNLEDHRFQALLYNDKNEFILKETRDLEPA